MSVHETPVRVRPLLLAVWFGLATGLLEGLLFAFREYLFGEYVYESRHRLWMSPLAEALLFLVPGIILALANRVRPGLVTLRAAVFVFAALGFASLLTLDRWFYWYTAAILAAGLAMQASRFVAGHAAGFAALVRRSVPVMLAIVAVAAVWIFASRALHERTDLEGRPAPPAGAPNVLLIVLDTVRADNLSAYGYAKPTTPRLEAFASRGTRFGWPISTAPWTLPSHAALFTGRHGSDTTCSWFSPLDATHRTLAEELGERGYATAGFVANLRYAGRQSGLARGFSRYEDHPVSVGQFVQSSSLGEKLARTSLVRRLMPSYQHLGGKTADAVSAEFLAWERSRGDRPFFAFLNYYDAHAPYAPQPPWDALFGVAGRSADDARGGADFAENPQALERAMSAYDGEIAYLDDRVGNMLDELEARGLLENTIVVITSDHGEEFGEHRLMRHGDSLYLRSLKVPLVIAAPGRVPEGRIVERPVTIRDVPATVMELLGASGTGPFPGRSLSRYWSGDGGPDEPLLSEVEYSPNQPDWYPVSKGDMKSVMTGRYRYILNGDGREELYDVLADPLETTDMAGLPEHAPLLARMREDLKRLLDAD